MLKPYLKYLIAPVAAIVAFSSITALAQTRTTTTTTCAFDPSLGRTNPLGLRVLITLSETEGNTTVVLEQLPSPVGVRSDQPANTPRPQATIAQRRTLVFYNTTIAATRQALLDTPVYYATLLGSESAENFGSVNATLTCKTANNPTPTPSPTASPTAQISSLPDGNYRYWTGKPTRGNVVSDEELLQKGGILFLFNKQGNQIVGTYGQIDNTGICLSGQINENTFTGIAIEQGDASVVSAGERFVAWDAAGLLRVRRGSKTGERIQYNSAIADLRGFTRINAGSREPVTRCP